MLQGIQAVPLKRIDTETVAEALVYIYIYIVASVFQKKSLVIREHRYLRLQKEYTQASWCDTVYNYTVSPDV